MTCFGPLSKKSVPVLCVLAGILCLSIATGCTTDSCPYSSKEGIDLTPWLIRCTRNIGTLATSYGDDCQPDEKNNDVALTEAITEVLQMWLEPLREYSKKPIVDGFPLLAGR